MSANEENRREDVEALKQIQISRLDKLGNRVRTKYARALELGVSLVAVKNQLEEFYSTLQQRRQQIERNRVLTPADLQACERLADAIYNALDDLMKYNSTDYAFKA